jgi:hypothetical protein
MKMNGSMKAAANGKSRIAPSLTESNKSTTGPFLEKNIDTKRTYPIVVDPPLEVRSINDSVDK